MKQPLWGGMLKKHGMRVPPFPPLCKTQLLLPIEMQLPKKPKIFCGTFVAFLRSALYFEHFETK